MKTEQEKMYEKLAEMLTRQVLNPNNDPVLDAIIDDAIADEKSAREKVEKEESKGATLHFNNVIPFQPREETVTAATPLPMDDKIEVEVEGMTLRGTPEQIIATMKMMESLGQKG